MCVLTENSGMVASSMELETNKSSQNFTSERNGENLKLNPSGILLSANSLPSPVAAGDQFDAAAVKLQKVYKSYRTRRNLADCAVVIEELWWKALDFAALRRSSVSFFDSDKSETAVSKWSRAGARAAKVGKGLSKNEKAQKLALRHWLEVIDPRHRYGHNLHLYYDVWFKSQSSQPFFFWLDIGDGKELSLEKCSRAVLQRQCVQYLGPKQRESYEVIIKNEKLVYRQTGASVHTVDGSKWIFVLSASRNLYVGRKIKGHFHHSSFLAGGATTASGRLIADHGVLKAIWPYSGHYRPTEENFMEFIRFLKENNVDLTNVKKYAIDDDRPPENNEKDLKTNATNGIDHTTSSLSTEEENEITGDAIAAAKIEDNEEKSKPNAGGDNEEETAETEIHRSVVKRSKWTTGAGPRIGCVREYPTKLQFQALKQLNLSPRISHQHLNSNLPIPSLRPTVGIHISPRLASVVLLSPRCR